MNLRHILRTNIRLNLEIIQATCEALNGDLEKSLIFAAVSAANVGVLHDDPALSRLYAHTTFPDELRRPIRVQRVAESLGLPRETTRVKVKLLVEEGLIQATRAGLMIAPATMLDPRFRPMLMRYMTALGDTIERLAAGECAGLASAERLSAVPFPAMWGAVRIVTQHVLRGTVDLRAYVTPTSLMGAYLYLAMADSTAFHFSDGPTVVYADHDDPPPTSARQTVTASALAARLGIPRETVRRNLLALVRNGWLFQRSLAFGLATTEPGEQRRRELAVQQRSSADLTRMIRRLRHIGAIAQTPPEGISANA